MSVVINGTTGITAPGLETFGDGTALGGATNPIVSMAKGANNYVQGYVVNNTAGTSSSADLVTYPDNGTDAHGWVDMGITSSVYADATYTVTGPNEAYLFGSAPSGSGKTGNLVIATDNTGTANSIQFYTNGFTQAKSAAKMVIDGATGNVGIGTSSPSYKLHVVGGQTRLDASSAGTFLVCLGTGSNFQVDHATSGYATLINSANTGAAMIFKGSSESMRIDTSGNLLVGTTSATSSAKVCVSASMNAYNGIVMVDTGSTGGNYMQFLNSTPAQAGAITHFGTTTVLYTTSSDYRLKENITPMTGALAKVAQLKPCTYTWKDGGAVGDGFIAHELQAVFPDAVAGEKDAVNEDGTPKYQGIDTSVLVATLTAAVQEQQALITQLQADVAELKASK